MRRDRLMEMDRDLKIRQADSLSTRRGANSQDRAQARQLFMEQENLRRQRKGMRYAHLKDGAQARREMKKGW